MKKKEIILISILIVIVIFIIAIVVLKTTSKDTENDNNTAVLIGNYVRVSVDIYENNKLIISNNIESNEYIIVTKEEIRNCVSFGEFTDCQDNTYVIDGNTIIIDPSNPYFGGNYTYELNDEELLLINENENNKTVTHYQKLIS